uniref:Histone-lysine N-methyltransferase 2C n=1 Tax=Pseudonaja textilis TaxID=8673 RepID=A0A670ZG30_PSETE
PGLRERRESGPRSPPPPPPPGASPTAAAAATDKRPRGRPRKDGASPFQRVRKKPRNRGKPAVEDEDSMDGLEATETENTVEVDTREQFTEEDAQSEVDDDKKPTPDLQCSVSLDSANTNCSIGVEAKSSEQVCAFCYCGERSSLGQGELKQFSPTPGFIAPWNNQPLNINETVDSNDTIDESIPRQNPVLHKARGQKKEQNITTCTCIRIEATPDDEIVKVWDELRMVGLPDDIDVQALFEPTGYCWAHHRCAEWSLEVCQTEEQLPANVDKAVVSGSTKRCAYCKHLGATIKCCEEKCTHIYHYPCAAGAGTFQDFNNFTLLCPDHIDQAPLRSKEEANCAVCDSPGDLLDQLFCTTCGQHYHGMCLDIQVTPIKRAGWQCPDCKVCQNCKQSGEDNKMLVCDTCDKGYHTFCLQPVMDSVPTNGWKCKNCRVCAECGTRSSSQWHHNCLMCDSCYRQQDNLPCPFCEKSPYPNLQKERLHCHMCKRWIHIGCDKPPDNELDIHLKEYICSLCKHSDVDQEHTQMCEMIETEQFLPEVDTDHICMYIKYDQNSRIFRKLSTFVSGLSLDEKKCELETQVSNHFDTEEGETSVKNTHASDSNPSDKKRETSENIPEITQQGSDKQDEETKPSQTSTELEVPQEECQLLQMEPENVSKICETFMLVAKEPASNPKEQSETVVVLESTTGRGTPEVSLLPQNESCATESCQLADKPSESLPETFSPCPSSAEISKAVDVSSLPTSSLDPSASHEMLRCQMSPLESAAVLPTTFVSLTPKIGMGKPAITKRKFSPGRPRSRQGTWNSHNTSSPPSWFQDISEGRETFKSRQLPSSAIWSIKVGRGSGFPGKRRPRGAGLSGRGGRGRSKLKNGIGSILAAGVTDMDSSSNKDEEENSMHNTVVLFSSSDKFTLHQDMCVVCGSFGQGAEGQLLACSQCGQCYHPYCVGIKITKVVLHKGWRCLECTVCEACGKATDPGRLLLCDDCDISYHTYCLDPPLQTVPKGGWKCKWCVWCRHCGATSPGLRCEWQNNYTQCAPCSSLSTCPVCCCNYREEELIMQCRQCDRWMHTVCQNLNTEEEVENTADNGFDCTMCRPYILSANVPSFEFCEPSIAAQIPLKAKELDPPKTYTQDGVCLTETGMSQLQSLSAIVPRRKRAKPKLKLKIINQNSVAVLQTPPDVQSEHSRDGEMDDNREGDLMDCEGKSDTSPEREPIDDDPKGMEATEGIKKRKRKPYRPGIGGFMVRQRSRTGQGKMKRALSRKDSSGSVSEQILGRDENWNEQLPDTLVDETMSVSENMEKMKKRYRKKKNKLEEIFPAYLQEAFFGKELLDTSRQSKPSLDNLCDKSLSISCKASLSTNFLDPSSDPLLSSTSTSTPSKSGAQGTLDDPLAALVLNTEDDILGILSDDLVKPGDHSDIGPISDDPSTSMPLQNVSQSTRPLSEEQLDGILSPELDKMVTDGAILGKLYKIPELGGKDVEDLFTAVLSPAATQSAPLPQPPQPPPQQLMHLHNQGENAFSRVPLMNGLIGQTPHLPHTALVPGGGLGAFSTITQPSYADTRDKNTVFNAMINDPNNPWVATATPLEGENDTMSNAQRSTLKWEKEEALGEMATVAPVLYTNINFPNLKEEFPDWTTRVKQIAKLWRKASSQERAPYVQKARDNRAALRINKVQMSNDSMKRQQQQDNIDPGSRIETDLFKDPLKQRESEHEQEWKFRQQMRQKSKQQAKIEATQKLEQVKNEQQQQQLQQQQLGSQQLVNQSGSDTPSSGMQSPLTPQTSNGNMSPAQQALYAKQLPGPSTSTSDVFLKPQAPPPPATANRMPAQDGHCQTPSQQTFSSSPSAQPPSPIDPYAKMVGTPRPPPVNQNQKFVRRNSATSAEVCPLPSISRPTQVSESMGRRPSPARDSCSLSPGTNDPYAKPPDTPRPVTGTEQFSKPLGISRSPLISEQPASSDQFAKPPPRTGGDTFQRPRISSTDSCSRPSLTSASVIEGHSNLFKTPACPNPSSQDSYTKMPPTLRRVAMDPYERPLLTPRPVDSFAHNPSSDSYNQSQLASHSAIKDTFAHPQRVLRNQSDYSGSLSRTVAQDPYAHPPSTPRPVTDPYAQPPGTPRPASDLYAQPPGSIRPVSVDPYMHQPLASRPPQTADLFAQVSANQRHSDLYAQPPGTPIPVTNDPYSQSPATQRSGISETFSRPITMSDRDPYLQASQSRTSSGTFVKPSDPSQPSKLPGSTVTDSFSHDPSPCDPFDQPPMTPRSQPEAFGTAQHPQDDQTRSGSEGNFNSSVNSSMNLQGKLFSQTTQGSVPGPTAGLTQNSTVSHTDGEKLRQRQKLREIILQQQQQKKNAIRQEKAPAEPASATPTASIQSWQQENLNKIFTRPPPPYPGNIRSSTVRPGGLRLAGFPVDGQLNRPQFPGDAVGMGMRPHAIRFGFPSGGHGLPPCQDHFLGPSQQMQHVGVAPQFRRTIPIDLPRLSNQPPMNNPIGLSQHFPPQGIQVQQHNIMGQAFIELCHRAPEVRPRLSFISSSTTIVNPVPEHQQQTELLPRQNCQGPRHLEPTRCNSQNSDNPLQSSTGLEHLAPSQQDKMNPGHPPSLVMCSLNHPSINNAFSGDSLPATRPDETNNLQVPSQPTDTLGEKLDPDDPSVKDLDVKDLDGVEVKDLVDEDLENLNLDSEDKGDELDTLDNLETNDRHLDDLLRSGEFDIIAYTDPDHDLGDKKGMFNEELDLNVPIDDIQGKAEDNLQKHSDDKTSVPEVSVPPQKKATENRETKTEVLSPIEEATCNHEKIDKNVAASSAQHDGETKSVLPCHVEATDKASMNEETTVSSSDAILLPTQNTTNSSTPGSTPVLTSLLTHSNSENPDTRLLDSPSHSFRTTQTNPISSIPQTLITSTSQNMENVLSDVNMAIPVGHSLSQGTAVNPGFISGQPLNSSLGVGQPGSQTGPVVNRPAPGGIPGSQQLVLSQALVQQQNRERPLLLEEQPLLLQDLLDQERQEQQQQRQMQAMIRQRSEPFFPNIDFDAITDPIMKAKMVALKGINKVMAQNNMGMPPLVMNRFVKNDAFDGSLTPQMSRPNPPNFGPGFVNDSYRKQYEEWLQETQQLLQMQQKYLEEQIGAHRKSKKALSAKQRTAKKAGREFPEEEAEQLKHVTEQQSMVQKQLEQIRKQQKEHAELIEEYRIKQQQSGMGPHSGMPGLASQPPIIPGGSSPAMGQQNFPRISQQLQHPQHTAGQPNPPRIPGLPSWQPPNTPVLFSHSAPRMPPPIPQLPVNPGTPASVLAPSPSVQSGPPPRVEFEDNNPFSESFQERERKERLREQQERQRIQLMQEVDRQRALQQRIEMEQHGTVGSELNARTSFPQISYLGSDRPCDFMRPPQPLQQSPQQPLLPPPPPQQQQQGSILQSGPLNSPPTATFPPCSEQQQAGSSPFSSDPVPVQDGSSAYHSAKQSHGSISGVSFTQSLPRPHFATGVPAVSPGTSSGLAGGQDSSLPPGTNFAGTNPANQSLIQLYSDIIPEEKGKKKRTRKKKKEDDTDSVNTPSTPHSDITAPPTPVIVDAVSAPALSTPGELARNLGETEKEELPNSATPSAAEGPSSLELKAQPAESNLPQNQLPEQSSLNPKGDTTKTDISASLQEIRPEKVEADQCSSQAECKTKTEVDLEDDKADVQLSPPAENLAPPVNTTPTKVESGNELLKHLLKNKTATGHISQKSDNSFHFPENAEENKLIEKQELAESSMPLGNPLQGSLSCGNNQVQRADLGHEMKKQRNKRTQRTGEKATSRPKRKKKEEEEKQTVFPSTETFMQLKQQNNLSNPPTPPASLPPTPPPVTCQKIVNGFAMTEELGTKAGMLGGSDALGSKQFQLPFRPQDDLLARAIIQGPKSVDVPASLPTPPHNNHEELRIQDPCEDRESPDSFVPSSSPESIMGMEISRYPDLSEVKEEMPQSVSSPVIPILPASAGKGSEAKQHFIKMEPCSTFFSSQLGLAPNNTESGLVSIAITLHPTAAENIGSVVAAFSNLLHVRIPNSYEISTASDVPSSIGIMNPHRTNPAFEYRQHVLFHGPQPGTFGPPGLTGPYGLKPHNAPFLSSGNVLAGYKAQSPNVVDGSALRSQWCSHCKVVVLGSGVRKPFKELHFLKQDSKEKSDRIEKDIVFCSNNCLVLYSASMQAKHSESKESAPPEIQFPMKEPPKGFHQYSTNISTFDVHCLPQLQEKNSPPSSPLIIFPPAFEAAKVEPKPEELKVTVKLKPRLRTVPNGLDDCQPVNKKWKGMKWKKWNVQIVIPKGTFKPSCEEEIDELLKKLDTTLKPDPILKDYRKCCFCHEEGDGLTDGPARLLNLDLDLWVHLNCALWSTEVYETQAGALINVELALRRGLQMKCVFCHKMGATSGCHRLRCTNVYHFTCAIKAQCMFFKDKTMLCPMHKPKSTHEQELSYFAVFRRVYVQRDEVRQIASIVQRGDREHTFRVGSLIFHSIGQLLPHQMVTFHSSKVLYPVGFEASRLYWSIRYTNRRSRYLCSIEEKDGFPLFVIRVIEQGHEDMVLTGLTPEDVWDKILEPIASIRKTSKMLQLFPAYLKGEDLFGLTVSAVARIAESLPGVEACERYTFRYGRNPLMELPLAINPTGCARSEPKMSSHVKRFVLRPHTLNSTSTSKSFQSTVTGELNAPYSKQFVHSKSSQYRKMKTEWKSNVYLARSRIQGLGLYAARDIEKHTMVIEYIGTIIRNEVANRKEKLYESQNRGVYMFRIDNDHVIDATLTGGPARYINHSCAPNCVAEVVTFERGHKIIISSNRRIQKGEELCYDYKFDFEDDQHKIACHCGAVNCRKWMN